MSWMYREFEDAVWMLANIRGAEQASSATYRPGPDVILRLPAHRYWSGRVLKLVTEFLTAGEAELAASTLEAAGIATYVSNSDSARLPIASSFAGGVGLWVVVDEQLWDAQQLLENPNHEVRSKLSEVQQREIQESVNDTGMNGALGLLFQLLGATILLAIVVFVITRL